LKGECGVPCTPKHALYNSDEWTIGVESYDSSNRANHNVSVTLI